MKSRRSKSTDRARLSLRAKYQPGETFENVAALSLDLDAGKYVMWNGKPLHPEIVRSMTFRTVERGMSRGVLRRAVRAAVMVTPDGEA